MKSLKRLLALFFSISLVLVITFTLGSCNAVGFVETPSDIISLNQTSTNEVPRTCQHQWVEADCLYPKTCRLCGEIEGEALGHAWIEATCKTPKTCSVCKTIEGEPIQHSYSSTITAPTCTEKGYTTYTCACGDTYKDNETSAFGHTEVVDAAVSATCTATGLTEGKHCSVCNKVIVAQTVISKAEHNYTYSVIHATCVNKGYVKASCDCGAVLTTDEIEPTGHSYDDYGICKSCGDEDPDYVKLTLTSSKYNITLTDNSDVVYITMIGGNTVVYDIEDTNIVTCEWGEWDGNTVPLTFYPVSIGDTFVTVYIEDYNRSIRIHVKVVAHNHKYTASTMFEPTCTEQGYTVYSCECGDTYIADYVNANGHTEVTDSAIEATLTSTGLTEGKHCSVCKRVLVEQKTIPMLELTPADKTTFELTNNLSQEYGYYSSRLKPYTKCKIDSMDCQIANSSSGKVTLKIKLWVKKTYQSDTILDNLKFNYTIYLDGVAVKSLFVTILNANFDTLYETTITYTGEPGNYTLTCESYY